MAEECTQETNDCDCNCLINQIAALEERDKVLQDRIRALELKTAANDTYLAGMYGFIANSGTASSDQSTISNHFDGLDLDGHFFAGDNNLPDGAPATIDANWINFDSQLTELYPALGDRDWFNDGTNDGAAQLAKFTLPDPERYYSVLFNNGGLELFVLNSNSGEAHGITAGSTQWKWLVDGITASAARWKAVMMHGSFLGVEFGAAAGDYDDDLDWYFERLGINLLIVGQDKANWHIRRNGLDIVNVGVGTETPDQIQPALLSTPSNIIGQPASVAGAYCPYADYSGVGDTGVPMFGTIECDWQEMRVKFRAVSDGSTIHEFTV